MKIKSHKIGTIPLDSTRRYLLECPACGFIGSSVEFRDEWECLQQIEGIDCPGEADEVDVNRLFDLLQAGRLNVAKAKQVEREESKPAAWRFKWDYEAENGWCRNQTRFVECLEHTAHEDKSTWRELKPLYEAWQIPMLLDCEAAAKHLAASFDYPWEFMPEQGREDMRSKVKAVINVALGGDQ